MKRRQFLALLAAAPTVLLLPETTAPSALREMQWEVEKGVLRATDKRLGISIRIIRQYVVTKDSLPTRFDVWIATPAEYLERKYERLTWIDAPFSVS